MLISVTKNAKTSIFSVLLSSLGLTRALLSPFGEIAIQIIKTLGSFFLFHKLFTFHGTEVVPLREFYMYFLYSNYKKRTVLDKG